MPISPLITLKAGKIDLDQSSKPYKSKPDAAKGYIYLYQDDDELVHFCWRERTKDVSDPELDLLMMPTDGHFVPYNGQADKSSSKTSGRIAVLKFSSSSARHLFWLQSKPETDDKSKFSERDIKICKIVDAILQGEEVDVKEEMATIGHGNGGDGDETMEDVEGHGEPGMHHEGSGGGAGPDATGGDIRQEGESSREGGADGGRAAPTNAVKGRGTTVDIDPSEAVRNFLSSVAPPAPTIPFTTLSDLLTQSTLLTTISNAPESTLDKLLLELPPAILLLAQEHAAQIDDMVEPTPAAAQAALEALSEGQKRATLKKVLLSPQFAQGMGSLETAIREGGLRDVAAALQLSVKESASEDPLKSFLEGFKRKVGDEETLEIMGMGISSSGTDSLP